MEWAAFCRELSPHRAVVRVVVDEPETDDGAACALLGGVVRGPRCRFAHTLPTTSLLRPVPGYPNCAETLVPDPCGWSSKSPCLYDVSLELRDRSGAVQQVERPLGFRLLATRGRRWWFEGEPWTPRCVARNAVTDVPLAAWREQAVTMVVSDEELDARLGEDASETGVPLFVRIEGMHVTARLRRVAAVPAVAAAIVNADENVADLRRAAPNLLLGALGSASGQTRAERFDFTVLDATTPETISQIASHCAGPVLAWRPPSNETPSNETLTGAANDCDELQRDLARWGEFAGYLVGNLLRAGRTVR